MTANPSPMPHMPETSVGQILQRGGEELALEKLDDRFVVSPTDAKAFEAFVQQLPAEICPTRSPAQMTELTVPKANRDAVMQQVRSNPTVHYASHVYRLKNSPTSLVYLTDQITVQFVPTLNQATIDSVIQSLGLCVVKPVPDLPNTFVCGVTSSAQENPVKLANRLMQRSDVLTAEPNIVVRTEAHYRPKDPLYPKQWHLNHAGGQGLASSSHISVEKAWDITRGQRSIVVAVMDDSVDINHSDFQGCGKLVAPRDFKENDFMPLPGEPEDNHGTACAGVAVAEENGNGAVGVAPGCALMPIRTTGFLDDESIEQLFDWAVQNGASVISCSWGPSATYFPLSLRQRNAITRAATKGRRGKGCVVLFAAGNANRPTSGTLNEQGWPNNVLRGPVKWLGGFTVHPDVITVSACTSLNKKSVYSNWGKEVSVCGPSNNAPPGIGLAETGGYVFTPPEVMSDCPGLGIVTTDRTGADGYDPSSFTSDFGGTSSACPLVAGVAALVLSANPDLTAAEVKQILQQTADKIIDPDPDPQFGYRKGSYEVGGHSEWFGYGKVNAFKAVQMAAQRQMKAATPSHPVQKQNPVAIAIPDCDLDGILSDIPVNETGIVRDIQVNVMISHPFMGDLAVNLVSPTGDVILLQGRSLGRQNSLKATYTLQNTPLLRRVLGQSAQGTWRLQVIDHAIGDTGMLQSWQLTLGV